jgi:Predicted P-loop-containing kinase
VSSKISFIFKGEDGNFSLMRRIYNNMEENKRELQSNLISIADGEAAKPNIILISGISGSGKSSALKILEDKGFFLRR